MHVRYSASFFRLWLCVLALAGVQVVHAQFTHAQSSSGWTIDWQGGTAQPTAQWVPKTVSGSTLAGGASWGVESGALVGRGAGRIPSGPGYIDVEARVVPTNATIGGAIGKALRKVGPLANVLAFAELAQELNYVLTKKPDGSAFIQRSETVGTYTYACQYGTASDGQGCVTNWVNAMQSFGFNTCNVTSWSWGGTAYFNGTPYSPGIYTTTSGNCPNNASPGSRTQTSTAVQLIDATAQELADVIALKSGWPTSSAIGRAAAEAILMGEPISGPVTVSGPASSPGTTLTKTEGGNTTVTTTTNNHNYAGNQITTTVTTSVSVNGVLQSSTTSNEPPKKDGCESNPDSLACQKLDVPSSDVLNKKTQAFTVTAVAFASSSVCPSPLSFSVRGSSYSVSYQPMCDRLSMLRTLFLAIAGVLAAFIVADSFRVQ